MSKEQKSRVENTTFDESLFNVKKKRGESESKIAIANMVPGETKRITHYDVSCKMYTDKNGAVSRTCGLIDKIRTLKKENGFIYETYHEEDGVIVVRCSAPEK